MTYSLLQFKKIAKGAILRAVLLGVLGIVTLLFPEFLTDGMVYAIAAYAVLNGGLGIVDFVFDGGGEEKNIAYFNAVVAGLAIVCGVLCIVYYRYLVSSLPVFLGVLLVIESVVYFIAALCVKSRLKALLIISAILLAAGGAALVLFTFGFGGIPTLSKMFGVLLLLSCASELLIYLMGKATAEVES